MSPPKWMMSFAGPLPSAELVWALAEADRSTMRRARRLVFQGRSADDLGTARVAIAMARAAERRAPGPWAVIFACFLGLSALSSAAVDGGLVKGTVARVGLGCVGVILIGGIAGEWRRSYVAAPRAERANLALLERSGVAYESASEGASIAVVPARLLMTAVALAAFYAIFFASALSLGGEGSFTAVVVPSAVPAVLMTAATMLRGPGVWRPRKGHS